MDMLDARARTARNATSAVRAGHASSSEDEMNLGITPRDVIATPAARGAFRPPMLNSAKRAKKPLTVFIDAPRAVGAKSSAQNGARRRMTTEQRRKEEDRARASSTAPLTIYTSTARTIQSSNPQRQKRKQEEKSAPAGLIKLGRGQDKGKPERPSSASTRELDNSDRVVDPESTDEDAPDSSIGPRTRQPFPLGDAGVPHQASKSSPDGARVSSQSKPHRRFDQGNQREKDQTAKPFLSPLSDAAALRGNQKFPLCSVEIPFRPVPSSSIVGSNPSTRGESLPASEDTPPRARRPFPLGTPSQSTSSSGSKRPSPDSLASEASPSQRIKLSKHQSLDALYIEDDSVIVEQGVDEESLCPYCDEPLPCPPSERLQVLLERARSYSKPQPRSSNSKALTAPFATFAAVCDQHRNEATVIPEGVAQGWPTRLDFNDLPARLRSLRPRLQRLIENPRKSAFFQDVMKDVASMGALAAVGAQGQLATFQRARPGYYGERGLVRITQIIGDLFPSLMQANLSEGGIPSFAPLDSTSFVTRVLVPESACLLIKDDLSLDSEEEALRVLFASQTFGAAVYPDREDELEMDNIGIEMRVRLKKGKERHERHICEAERALRRSDTETEASSISRSTSFRARKGKTRPQSRTPSVSSEKSSLVSISSDGGEEKNDGDPAVLLLHDRTPKPRKKKKILPGASTNNLFPLLSARSSQAPPAKPIKHKSDKACRASQRSASVTSIRSRGRPEREWTRSIREQDFNSSSDEI